MILVTGGAGYIGSHIVRELVDEGREVVVLDDLSTGHREAIRDVPLIEADMADSDVLKRLFADRRCEWVVHMAASSQVGRSMREPAHYYDNNVIRSLRLLDAARRGGVRGFVFSSSAAVYGEPRENPVTEDQPTRPTSPYGETKLAFERALDWHHRAYGLRWVALRYFNAAGAHPHGDIGEDHAEETHLIPRLLSSIREPGQTTPIFGDDYPTHDGTCVRDYVHVVDLARAHVAALDALREGRLDSEAINLGNGRGFTVREVIDAVESACGTRPATRPAPRRPGDPAVLVASADRAGEQLGWSPACSDLATIVGSAWRWHLRNPEGYRDRGARRPAGRPCRPATSP